jgi:hypothetical protein
MIEGELKQPLGAERHTEARLEVLVDRLEQRASGLPQGRLEIHSPSVGGQHRESHREK